MKFMSKKIYLLIKIITKKNLLHLFMCVQNLTDDETLGFFHLISGMSHQRHSSPSPPQAPNLLESIETVSLFFLIRQEAS